MGRKTVEEKVVEIQKVVMYSRIGYSSGSETDEQKFIAQEEAMEKFCKENSLEVKAMHREIAPGTLDHWSRPVLDDAVKSLKWSKKEKSVLLVSRLDRLSKSFSEVGRLMNGYNPKLLVVSSGMRSDKFVLTIQAACAEEEFRFKYGKLYHTSEAGYKRFYDSHKFYAELFLSKGMTKAELVAECEKYQTPTPWELEWNEELIDNILKYGESK